MKIHAFPLAALVIFAAVQTASAQQAAPPQTAQPAAKPDWDIRLGAGALLMPDYEGSDDMKVAPVPLINISYRDIAFLRFNTLGVNAFTWQGPRPTDKLQVGPLLRYQFGRDEGDNDALRGLGDIDDGAELGAFITYRSGSWTTGVTVFRDISDAYDGGMTARFAGGYMHSFSPRLRGRAELAATWADDSYTESFFGVTAAQALRSGLRQYKPESGLKDAGLTFDLDYSLTEHWGLTGRLGYKRLLGDAADSPLVKDKGSADQFSGGVILTYKF